MNLGVLISGRGTNLAAILDAVAVGELRARVAMVVSNKPEAQGLARAAAAGVPTRVIPHGSFRDRVAFDEALVDAMREASVDTVVLAGFMRLLTPVFMCSFQDRVINIHPSLLPAFPGVDAQGQALACGVRITGCTVHVVDSGMDSGAIIAQAAVPVLEGDDRDTLAARILVREHELLVRVLRWVAEGKVDIVSATEIGQRTTVRVRGERTFFGLAEPAPP
jgi:phosphoribosylglycinamide formyltransferase-1